MQTITHDFKIPTLAQLRGLEIISNETLGILNNEQKNLILQIESSCKFLLEMITMISSVWAMDNNTYRLNYEKINLGEAVYYCFNKLQEEAKEKNLTFSLNTSCDSTSINADKTEIQKVILNLLYNAINNTRNGGNINVKIENIGNDFLLSITGIMYSKDSIEYTTIGYSLGMYICKKIIEAHGGKITTNTDNNHLDKYSFTLPKESAV